MRGIPLIYYVWHPYTHVYNIMWRKFLPLFAHITAPVFEACVRMYNQPKLIVTERNLAALSQPRTYGHRCSKKKLPCFQGRGDQAALHTHDGLRILRGLDGLLNYYLRSGTLSAYLHLGRARRRIGHSSYVCISVPYWSTCGPCCSSRSKNGLCPHNLLRTTVQYAIAQRRAGGHHMEECWESLLAKLPAGCKQHPDKHTTDDASDLFRNIPPSSSTCNGVPLRKCVC